MKNTATISTEEYLHLVDGKEQLHQLRLGNTVFIEKDWTYGTGWYDKVKFISTDVALKEIGTKAEQSERLYKDTLKELVELKRSNEKLEDDYDIARVDIIECKNMNNKKILLWRRIKILFTGRL